MNRAKILALIKNIIRSGHLGEQLFLLAFVVFTLKLSLETTMFNMNPLLDNLAKLIFLVAIAFKIAIFDRYKKWELFAIIGLLSLGVVTFIFSKSLMPLYYLLMVAGAKDCDIRRIMSGYCIVKVSVLILAYVGAMICLIPNLQYKKEEAFLGVRNSFGIAYPTDFAAHVFFLMLALAWLIGAGLRFWHFIIALLICTIIFIFSYTKLDCSCMYLGILIYFIKMLKDNYSKNKREYGIRLNVSVIAALAMPVAAFFMTFLTLSYVPGKKGFMQELDEFLTHRLRLGYAGFMNFKITPFGAPIEMIGGGGSTAEPENYNFVDCSYHYVLFLYGLVIVLVMMLIYAVCCYKMRSDSYYLIAVMLIALNCIVAHHWIEVAYNPFAYFLFARLGGAASENARCSLTKTESKIDRRTDKQQRVCG